MARWRFYLSGGNDLDYHTYGIVEADDDNEAFTKGEQKFVPVDHDAWDEAGELFGMEWSAEEREEAEDDDTAPFFSVEELTEGETMADFDESDEEDDDDDDEEEDAP